VAGLGFCASVLGGLVLVSIAWIPAWRGHFGTSVDLQIFRTAGQAALHGYSLYGPGFLQRADFHLGFTYPPFAAVAMVPLALAPLPVDYAAWTALSVLALGLIVFMSFRPLLDRLPAPATKALAMGALTGLFMLTYPVGRNLDLGQVEIFLTLACLLDVVPARTPWPRGVLVGLAAAVKLTPALFVVYFVVTRQWRAAAVSTATTGVAWVLAAFVFPADSRRYFLDGVAVQMGRFGGVVGPANQSLWGTMHRDLGAAGQATWVVAAIVVAFVGLIRARAADAHGQRLAAATLIGLTSVLISPVSWLHHGIWLVPAAGVLVGRGRSPLRFAAATVVVVLMLAVQPYPHPVIPIGQQSWFLRYVVHESFVLLYLALLAVLPITASGSRSPRADEPGQQLAVAART
jgi:alpha-1,2-mannosyltransferase